MRGTSLKAPALSLELLLTCLFLLSGGRRAVAQQLSPLAPKPSWADLEPFQETITHDEFVDLLDHVFAPGGAAKETIDPQPTAATVKTGGVPWVLRFAASPETCKPSPHFWRSAAQLGPAAPGQSLAGLKIAIDPGHIGGAWARMEERFFQIGESKPVEEGELTLRVARRLQPLLQEMGAAVTLVRSAEEPVTSLRPDDLRPAARAELKRMGLPTPPENYSGPNDPLRGRTVQAMSEILFYRTSEIRHRAMVVNEEIRPDLVLCLHFNADPWGDPSHPDFVARNHFHVLLNGCYSAEELRHEDVRFDMLMKLLGRCFPEELSAGAAVAASLAEKTRLPPYTYTTPNALPIAHNEYLWARNLLANRLYRTPVIFLEPYVMNSEVVWERVQAGDYDGEFLIGGELRTSIFREYAQGVADGLRACYSASRP